MSHDKFIKEIKSDNFNPVYFLHGDESYFIDEIVKAAENKLSEGQKAFNLHVIYGKEANASQIIDAAHRMPMMAPCQVIILKEAQDMKDLGNLKAYIEKPVKTTLLVCAYKNKKLDGRTAFSKSLKKNTSLFHAKKMYDNEVQKWIQTNIQSNGYSIEPGALLLMHENIGNAISKLNNELQKLYLNLQKGEKINANHIEKYIGVSKDFNVFELQKALGTRNAPKALRIVNYFIANPKGNPLVMVLSSLYNYYEKVLLMHYVKNKSDNDILKALKLSTTYFIRDYKTSIRNFNLPQTEMVIHLLHEYDLKSKGVDNKGATHGALMQEVVSRILLV